MTFAVGTPYTRVGASEGYLQSLANAVEEWAHQGEDYYGYRVEAGTSYGQNRNRLVSWFLTETPAEWLLQLDDDIRFPRGIVAEMREGVPESARVIVGSVPVGANQPSNVYADEECLAVEPVEPAEGEVARRVRGFGGAILLVHRSVYLDMARRFGWLSWFTVWSDAVPGAVSREYAPGGTAIRELEPDLSFARRLKAIGVAAWARFGLAVTHTKPIELRGE